MINHNEAIKLLSEVETIVERWRIGRENDDEAMQKIFDLLNQKKENDNGN
jgi:hypothetical protein